MQQKKVAIADDDADVLEVMCDLVREGGMPPVPARDGEEAVAALASLDVGAAIVDLRMPRLSGRDVLLKARELRPTVPVVIFTAYGDLDCAVQLMQDGAFDYFAKPVPARDLIAVARRALQQHALLEELARLEAENATYQSELEKRVIDQTEEMTSLYELANDLNRLDTLNEVLQRTASYVCDVTGSATAVALLGSSPRTLSLGASVGVPARLAADIAKASAGAVAQTAFEHSGPVTTVELPKAPASRAGRKLCRLFGEEFAFVALRAHDQPLGLLGVGRSRGHGDYPHRELRLLRYTGDAASVAIANLLNREHLEASYLRAVQALAVALESKDCYRCGHSERVAGLSVAIGRCLSLAPDQLSALEAGALLHDIGTVAVPHAILEKPGPLTRDELLAVQQHPIVGERLVKDVPFLRSARATIRQHHERWNGGGYPDQLRREEVSLDARIVAVADTFDAMTSKRPHRAAYAESEAVDAIEAGRGTEFDPRVVDASVEVLESGSPRRPKASQMCAT
jgi:response regulator RpfG family c-di-GMP phosphodiesterase